MNRAETARVVVIGAGDDGRVVLDILQASGGLVLAFLDDNSAAAFCGS